MNILNHENYSIVEKSNEDMSADQLEIQIEMIDIKNKNR